MNLGLSLRPTLKKNHMIKFQLVQVYFKVLLSLKVVSLGNVPGSPPTGMTSKGHVKDLPLSYVF